MDIVSKSKELEEETTELVKRFDIEDSPFIVIETRGQFFGAMGNYRLTEMFDDLEMCKRDVQSMTWNRVVQVMMLLNEKLNSNNILKED